MAYRRRQTLEYHEQSSDSDDDFSDNDSGFYSGTSTSYKGKSKEAYAKNSNSRPTRGNAEQNFDKARRLYLPNDKTKRGEMLSDAASKINSSVFLKNTEKLRESGKPMSNRIAKEADFDCIAISVQNSGNSGLISGNVKERTRVSSRKKEYGEFGLSEARHSEVIKTTLNEQSPALRNVDFDIIVNSNPPGDRKSNAMLHAEMQQVSHGLSSDSTMGVSKPPCSKCEDVLKNEGFSGQVFHSGEREQNLNPKNWEAPHKTPDPNNNPNQVKTQFKIPKKSVIVENDFRSDKLLKSYTQVKKQNDSLSEHVKRNVTTAIKPRVNASLQAVIETVVEDYDRPMDAYQVGPNSSAGTYQGKRVPFMMGAYARASTFDAGVQGSVAHAKVNGPAAGAGVHLSCLGVGAYANAELARAEASLLGVNAGVGLNLNTGASFGVDGASASFLGFGASIGPTLAVKTPVADVSCVIS